MTFGELMDRVTVFTGLEGNDAFEVAQALWDEVPEVDTLAPEDIRSRAIELGKTVSDVAEPTPAKDEGPEPELEMDPAQVLLQVYQSCPRVLAHEQPRIGRAPKSSQFFQVDDEEVEKILAGLPEETRLLIGEVDLWHGKLKVTLYDEANDLNREVGPLDLDRYDTSEKLNAAITLLLGRLSRVLSADYN